MGGFQHQIYAKGLAVKELPTGLVKGKVFSVEGGGEPEASGREHREKKSRLNMAADRAGSGHLQEWAETAGREQRELGENGRGQEQREKQ